MMEFPVEDGEESGGDLGDGEGLHLTWGRSHLVKQKQRPLLMLGLPRGFDLFRVT